MTIFAVNVGGLLVCESCRAAVIDGHEADPAYHWEGCAEMERVSVDA